MAKNPYFLDNLVVILINIITTAVVLIKAEILADSIIKAGVSKIRGRIFNFFIPSERS